VLSRLVEADARTVSYLGRDLLQARPEDLAREGIGRTFQSPVTFRGLTLVESVLVGMQGTIRAGLTADLLRTASYRRGLAVARTTAADLLLLVGFDEHELDSRCESLNFAAQRLA